MILFRLIIFEYFKYLTLSLFFANFLFIVFNFIENTGKILNSPSSHYILRIKYYLYSIPYKSIELLPMVSMLSSILTIIILSRFGQITAMRASGRSPLKIFSSILIGGFFVSLLSAFVGEKIVPTTSYKAQYILNNLIGGDKKVKINEEIKWGRKENILFNFLTFNEKSLSHNKIRIIKVGKNFTPHEIIYATEGVYFNNSKELHLKDVKIIGLKHSQKNSTYNTISSLNISPPLNNESLYKKNISIQKMSISELSKNITLNKKSGLNTINLEIFWHVKFAFYFAIIFITFLTFPLIFTTERKFGTLKNATIICTLGVIYWIVMSFGRILALQDIISPMIAGWAPNFYLLIVSIWRYIKVQRQ